MALKVGILNPGAMGAAVGALLKASPSVSSVMCALQSRSEDTVRRAKSAGFTDVGTLGALCSQADVIFSIVPPANAMQTAQEVAAIGFRGIYCDANAISSETSRAIATLVRKGGAQFVDGGIIGSPPVRPGTTRLYLSGDLAGDLAVLFDGSVMETITIPGGDGAASALKIVFSAHHKGLSALLFNIRALAKAEGVDEALQSEWSKSYPDLADLQAKAIDSVPPKAWRFVEEMEEIAGSFERAGLSGGFHHGAADVFSRMAGFKGRKAGSVSLDEIVSSITHATDGKQPQQQQQQESLKQVQQVEEAMVAGRKASQEKLEAAKTAQGAQAAQPTVTTAATTSTGGSDGSHKLRILCLHGWRTSGTIMKYQSRDFPADVCEYTYIDGAHPARGPPHEVVAAFFQGPYFEWWDKVGDTYEGMQDTLDAIKHYNATNGPFDGVMGFSQGACLASILCAMAARKGPAAPIPSLRFGILASGFVPRDESLTGLFEEGKALNFPVMVLHGKDDFLKEGSENLARFFVNPVVSEHGGSHELPSNWNGPETLAEVKRFLRGMRW